MFFKRNTSQKTVETKSECCHLKYLTHTHTPAYNNFNTKMLLISYVTKTYASKNNPIMLGIQVY